MASLTTKRVWHRTRSRLLVGGILVGGIAASTAFAIPSADAQARRVRTTTTPTVTTKKPLVSNLALAPTKPPATIAASARAPQPAPVPQGSGSFRTSEPSVSNCPARTFCENFNWHGEHAATINGGHGTTVWWNPDDWDARGDTVNFGGHGTVHQFHVDVHRAAGGADPTKGKEDNSSYVVNGARGVPGVGVMRTEQQGIASARLRNPLLISQSEPATVEFYASRFVTGGHWWEIAITPAGITTGGENTAVPSMDVPMLTQIPGRPLVAASGRTNPAADSINIIPRGVTDDCFADGFRVGFTARQSIGGQTRDFANMLPSLQSALLVGDANLNKEAAIEDLYQWRARFWPDRAELSADFDRNGTFEFVNTWNGMTIPWNEVHLSLLSVAYNAAGHPFPGQCNPGTAREMIWRNVRAYPVKFATTAIYPRESGTTKVPRNSDFTAFDLRDNQRLNPPPRGDAPPQPNDIRNMGEGPLLFCSGYCYNAKYSNVKTKTLSFDLPSLNGVREVRMNYDVWRLWSEGTISASVNGQPLGALPRAATIPGAHSGSAADPRGGTPVERSIDVPVGFLRAGKNTLTLQFSGTTKMDRIHFEFGG